MTDYMFFENSTAAEGVEAAIENLEEWGIDSVTGGEAWETIQHFARLGATLQDSREADIKPVTRSLLVGDQFEMPNCLGDRGAEWEVLEIEQPYDEHGQMLEPIVHLKCILNAAWPAFAMTKKERERIHKISLSEALKWKYQPKGS